MKKLLSMDIVAHCLRIKICPTNQTSLLIQLNNPKNMNKIKKILDSKFFFQRKPNTPKNKEND